MNSSQSSSVVDDQCRVAQRRIFRWHSYQILCFGAIFVCCTISAFCLSYAFLPLQPDCLLFSTWNLTVDHATKSIYINYDQIDWGYGNHCNLTLYTEVAASLAAFMTCWFFAFFRPKKIPRRTRSNSTASTLVLPTLIVSFVFAIVVCIAWITVLWGVVDWCGSIKTELESCQFPEGYTLKPSWNVRIIDYFGFVTGSLVFGAFGCILWVVVVVSLSMRWCMHIDFPKFYFLERVKDSLSSPSV
ncbi:SMEK protein [Trichuris trichiura]|uniref:SMEK protein n=1 Tax=Trichuris trichiura TaxID=36087 RepID=A0A077Z0T9_TRITR|nr:SMEK protein [Trichuris trichiura]